MLHALAPLVTELVLPPLGPFLLLLAAYLARRRFARVAGGMATMACAWMLLFSLPGTYRWLKGPWAEVPAQVRPPYPPADAIVVLGGGRYLDAPEYGGDTAGASTLERVRYAARLQRETGLPLLVSGGKQGGTGTRSEAEIMQRMLEDEYGVPVRWVEGDSGNTRDNARLSAPLLARDGVRRVYLVTHGYHVARAGDEFERRGIAVVPMPTGYERPDPDSVSLWIPSFYGLSLCRHWLQEKLAPWSPF